MSRFDEMSFWDKVYSWAFWGIILTVLIVGSIGGILYIVHCLRG